MIREQGLAEDKLAILEVVAMEPFAAVHMQQDLLYFLQRAMALYSRLAIQEETDSNLEYFVAHPGVGDLKFVD